MQDIKPENNKMWVVIPAAGIGSRMQADRPKQYLKIENKTVLEYTLDCFLGNKLIKGVCIAIAPEDPYWPVLNLDEHPELFRVEGGQERCHSVFNALLHLMPMANENDWVLVHDAARPCLRNQDLETLIDSLKDDKTGGLLAVKVKDTMKLDDGEDRVKGTVDRNHLWHALTPQMFPLGKLFTTLKQALDQGHVITDEASAIELGGERPRLIEGHADNIKITQPEDLMLAQFYLQQQGRIDT